ncbi:DNA-processing protein DprA [Porphyromonas circumdentaria]|uniref:DNA processing protein n=1 Tax=Porphyromonas circumdentaria TaxID=29524 RepID=A0A1T4Q1G1_9PORP|nr:DNA-processing protein DprA [Porphyromonas circumdentaria]MBB6276438.1 DNA processing protein [Porphyromonas circumdentaria]MDO4723077.1 DNA-processing protein DprA [Porphyromonas circumdentaria]SJZ97602.1 DNA processing protein [Porphyromonas circumdentaria]
MIQRASYLLALSRLEGMGCITMRRLLEAIPSIEDIFSYPESLQPLFPQLYRRFATQLSDPDLLAKAQRELEATRSKGIEIITLEDDQYPQLLSECIDAPPLLFYKGKMEALQTPYKLSIVGTRKATPYGRKVVAELIGQLATQIPNLAIVSGLAYGIDIAAHRAALENHLPTIAVLAHGLDRIYPAQHRKEAIEILQKGGLLTEYPLGSSIERYQFVGRNRIVAGLSSATLVVESALRGGALLTASMATDYDREVFAIPGRLSDQYSKGCNQIIARQQAQAISSAEDIIHYLGWNPSTTKAIKEKQASLFLDIELPNNPILQLLQKEETIHFNELIARLNLSPSELANKLFDLEMDGLITTLPGGKYSLA